MPYPQELLDKYKVLADPNDVLQRNVQNIVASYNGPWDPLTELIQNSIDAINQRAARDRGSFRGRLIISVDAGSNTITIEDNGIGIPPQSADTLILPGGSFKTAGNTYGHKGLGFTYCAHIASYIEVQTEEYETGRAEHWRFTGGFEWLFDPTKTPILEHDLLGSIRSLSGPGTAVRIRFAIGQYEPNIANTSVLEKLFTWAADRKLLEFVLRTRTAIGHVGRLFGEAPEVEVDIEARLLNSNENFAVPYSSFDFQNHAPLNQQNLPRATDYATQVYLNPNYANKTHYGLFHVFSSDAANPDQPLRVGRTRGGVSFSTYLYACGKDNLAEALAQYDGRLVEDFKFLAFTTDVHLAIDGMPCGVPIDSWNNFGAHEQRYFALVNTELGFGTVLDAGRKTITRYYVDLIVDKIVEMTKNPAYFGGKVSFYEMSAHLHTRPAPSPLTPLMYMEKWDDYVSLPSSALLLTKIPDDELGAYVLFGELVGRGYIPGYRIIEPASL